MVRIAAISFLNAAPLLQGLDELARAQQWHVRYALPSECAQLLRNREVDFALVPVAAAAAMSDVALVPGICIGCDGPVQSIFLISKVPVAEVRSLAADTSSRSSVAMCEVLLRKFHGVHPQFAPKAPELEQMLAEHDAALIIGDPALRITPPAGAHVFDMGEMWKQHTGLPFVFACWAAVTAGSGEVQNVVPLLHHMRDEGRRNLPAIAEDWSPRLGIPAPRLLAYLQGLRYQLDAPMLRGMSTFLRYAHELGVLPPGPEPRFLASPKLQQT